VTGASGRIGRRLVRALQAEGHWVRGFDLAGAPEDSPDELVVGSLLDPETLEQALEGIEGVVHLAALMSWQPKDEAALFDVNVRGTFNLLQVVARQGVQRFVFASSGEVYPELDPTYLPIDESHPARPTSVYGLTKLLGEEIVRNFGRRTGLPFCILRFAHTQSPEELLDPHSFFSGPRFYVNAKLRQLRALPASPTIAASIAALEEVATEEEQHYIGCSPGGVTYRMGICDVRDMVTGIQLALVHPVAAGERFNIGPASSFNFDEAVPYLAKVTGLPAVRVCLATTPYRYDTSVEKATRTLGYEPRYSIFQMIDDAARFAPIQEYRDAR
jgi:UDP-glucose 4-epimerase